MTSPSLIGLMSLLTAFAHRFDFLADYVEAYLRHYMSGRDEFDEYNQKYMVRHLPDLSEYETREIMRDIVYITNYGYGGYEAERYFKPLLEHLILRLYPPTATPAPEPVVKTVFTVLPVPTYREMRVAFGHESYMRADVRVSTGKIGAIIAYRERVEGATGSKPDLKESKKIIEQAMTLANLVGMRPVPRD